LRANVRAALAHLEEVPIGINALGTRILHAEDAQRSTSRPAATSEDQAA
jgi:hypothetical protein